MTDKTVPIVERLPQHVEWLACHALGMDMAKWSEISNDFLQSAETIRELVEALESIRHWAETSYSTDFFEEPDLEAVNRVLTENGLRGHMDRMHASWGRHLMQGVGKIATAALAKAQ